MSEKIAKIISHNLISKLYIFFTINLLSNKEQIIKITTDAYISSHFLIYLLLKLWVYEKRSKYLAGERKKLHNLVQLIIVKVPFISYLP